MTLRELGCVTCVLGGAARAAAAAASVPRPRRIACNVSGCSARRRSSRVVTSAADCLRSAIVRSRRCAPTSHSTSAAVQLLLCVAALQPLRRGDGAVTAGIVLSSHGNNCSHHHGNNCSKLGVKQVGKFVFSWWNYNFHGAAAAVATKHDSHFCQAARITPSLLVCDNNGSPFPPSAACMRLGAFCDMRVRDN